MKNRIEELRRMQSLTQEALADIVMVSRQTINAIENNKYNPTLPLAMRLARTLGVSVDDLFSLED
ncbi:MAG: helix-turn-helix transcriptional regulator [Chloroflexota bacterium]